MADLRVKSTGREFRRVDNNTALLLEELFPGDLERINAPARAPGNLHPAQAVNSKIPNYPTPQWGVGMSGYGEPTITLQTGRTELFYAGTPAGAAGHFKRAGFDLPKEILAAFINLLNRPVPSSTITDAEANDLAERQARNK